MDVFARSHDEEVARIAAALGGRRRAEGPVRIARRGAPHLASGARDPRLRAAPVDVSRLDRVLSIDPDGRECVAEAAVTAGDLLQHTLRFGLIPEVVPGLTGVTLGGAVAGGSVGSTSFRSGAFHDGCRAYEIVTGEGEVLTCSRAREPLAFDMIHASAGTLGVLTRLTFNLVPAGPFVRLEYLHFTSFERFQAELFERARARETEFLDGIVHGPRSFVVCVGQSVGAAPYLGDYRWLDAYYRSTALRSEDYLTVADYLFRYDTDCHWRSRAVPLLGSRPGRFLAGKRLLGSTSILRWSRRLAPLSRLLGRPDAVADVVVPARRFAELHAFAEGAFGFYPLWVVPCRMARPYPWIAPAHAARMRDDLLVHCGFYGMPNDDPDVDRSALLEARAAELDGLASLGSPSRSSPEQFWSIRDRERYDEAKRRLDPRGVFAGLYEELHGLAPRPPTAPEREAVGLLGRSLSPLRRPPGAGGRERRALS